MRNVFVCAYTRTAFGRYGGALSSVRADDMAAYVIKAVTEKIGLKTPASIDEVVLGCANQAGEDNRNIARMAVLLAGLPETVPGTTVNRLCASSLDAIAAGARQVMCGEADLVLAGGVENMSRAPFVFPKSENPFSRNMEVHDTTLGWRFVNPKMKAQYGTDSLIETAENVAQAYAISREDQDRFAFDSQQKAAKAQQNGFFAEEITPLSIPQRKKEDLIVDQDEHMRPDTTFEKLQSLKPLLSEDGSVTAGNASGINDGASIIVLASEDAVEAHALEPLARIVGSAASGVAPSMMGMGPVDSTNKLLNRLSLNQEDLDFIGINEAFASQVLACLRELKIQDHDPRVNPDGGAIALGHPLGASGARLVGNAALNLKRNNLKHALVTMCVGVGQGQSMILEGA